MMLIALIVEKFRVDSNPILTGKLPGEIDQEVLDRGAMKSGITFFSYKVCYCGDPKTRIAQHNHTATAKHSSLSRV